MKRRSILAIALALLAATAGQAPLSSAPRTTAPVEERPNVLIIVTDDQRGRLGVMPETRKRLKEHGTQFKNGFVTTPLCCPSRASIFTGRFAHNHHVFSNDGGAGELVQQSTLQYYLQQAGYETAIYGKYLNSWNLTRPPPFFDKWSITAASRFYRNGTWNVNGTVQTLSYYETSYISRRAQNFLTGAGAESPPWFLYLAPAAPHFPFTPQRKYQKARVPTWDGDPGVFEKNRSDKPPYVQDKRGDLGYGQRTRRSQFRTLMSVDDLVSKLFATLIDLHEAHNTLVFFISDNGLMWGEHGLEHKNVPYEQDIHVPFLARWPGHFLARASDSRLVANIDIAPTVLAAAGITPDPAYPIDGRSLLGTTSDRSRLLIEHFPPVKQPDEEWAYWASIRTTRYKYTEYYEPDGSTVKFREYYDLRTDPWELRNLLGDSNASNDPDVASLSAQLAQDRGCEGSLGPRACP